MELNGTGECIAILEFGGGYRNEELKTYFNKLGISTPTITAVSLLKGAGSR